jgi:hypothetical protein
VTLVSYGGLVLLGAFHGLNPGMGWLFAVALGMQEHRASAVWRALLPIALGHAGAIAMAIAVGLLAGVVIPTSVLRWPVAALLVLLGIRRLLGHNHRARGGMRIGMGGLAIWSFLMATAHGAGLMVLPVWLGLATSSHSGHVHGMHATTDLASGFAALAIHSGSYLLVTALMAWIIFAKLGVELLRTTWINLDVIWAVALIVSGGLTVALAA